MIERDGAAWWTIWQDRNDRKESCSVVAYKEQASAEIFHSYRELQHTSFCFVANMERLKYAYNTTASNVRRLTRYNEKGTRYM
jgi:hypothetical protein